MQNENGVRWDEDTKCIKDSSDNPIISVRLLKPLKIWAFDHPEGRRSTAETTGTTAQAHAVR